SDASTFEGQLGSGPDITIHQLANLQGGRLQGSGRLLEGGNQAMGMIQYQPSTMITLRADLTYYKDAMAGSHQFQTRFFGPRRPAQHLPHDEFVPERGVHHGGPAPGRPERPVEGPRAVPPPVRDAARADVTAGARPQLRGLRAGQLEADGAPHRERRRPLRLG